MNGNKLTITKKFELIPEYSEIKIWKNKVIDYVINKKEDEISYYYDILSGKRKSNKYDKNQIKKRIEETELLIERLKTAPEITRKMVNDYTYNLVRVAMDAEATMKNHIINYIVPLFDNSEIDKSNQKEINNFIKDALNYAYRKQGSKKGSLFDNKAVDMILGGYSFAFNQELTKKIKDCINAGMLNGKCSIQLASYKMNSPFHVAKTSISITHEYKDYEELCEHINDKDCKFYFNFGHNGNPTIAKFKINIGPDKNRKNLLCTLLKIISNEYLICGSSISLDKSGKKIILNLSMEIPKQEIESDENTVVGVDLGIAIPAVCGLNNNEYYRKSIGSKDDFLRMRTQIQEQRKRLQQALKMTGGGHGRKKKLKALDKLSKRERNFVNTYNHKVSKMVVDFAIKNHAKYINIENLKGYDTNKFILRNWSYYELQQQITYKAAKYGIEVRKINPCYTSQVCSCCGHWEEGQRKDQSHFVCNKCGAELNADFNASRNIAKSTLFYDSETHEEQKQEARDYYGIVSEMEKDKLNTL